MSDEEGKVEVEAAWVVIGVMAVVSAIGGSVVGSTKGRANEGAVLGLIFGVFGLVAVAAMPPSERLRQSWAEEARFRAPTPSSRSGAVVNNDRLLAAVQAMRRDSTLVGGNDRESLQRLSDAVDEILLESEQQHLWYLATRRLAGETTEGQV